jgi:geranylgeranyl pyrophosphate synthase
MANTDDTSKKQNGSTEAAQRIPTQIERFLEVQRRKLLQAHSVLHCLYEVLLYADGDDTVTYAEAAHLASMLVDDVIEQLDTARLQPMIDALKREASTGGGGDQVREPNVFYIN